MYHFLFGCCQIFWRKTPIDRLVNQSIIIVPLENCQLGCYTLFLLYLLIWGFLIMGDPQVTIGFNMFQY